MGINALMHTSGHHTMMVQDPCSSSTFIKTLIDSGVCERVEIKKHKYIRLINSEEWMGFEE